MPLNRLEFIKIIEDDFNNLESADEIDKKTDEMKWIIEIAAEMAKVRIKKEGIK
jgi:frataxin-like iron-binding protein CyaY